jgi:5'-nucleotidase
VGIMGLAESDWIQTLAVVDPATLDYRDFVAEGRRLAAELKVGACVWSGSWA